MNAKHLLIYNRSLANYSLLLPPPLYRRLWFDTRSAYQLRKHSAQIIDRPKTPEEERANAINKRIVILLKEDLELEAIRMIQECGCRNCKKRQIGCHATCQDYIEWRKAYDRERKQIQERLRSERIADEDYHSARRRRRKR